MNQPPLNDETARMAESAADLLGRAASALIVSHQSPDGDSIGTQLALGHVLEPIVQRVTLIGADPVPPLYSWLPGAEKIKITDTAPARHELIVALECCDLARTGIRCLEADAVINVDHHEMNDHYGRLNWVSSAYSSVGEMIYHVARRLTGGGDLPRDAATCLYTAILTDTGSFRFSNTSAEAFRICARLVEMGATPADISAKVYDNYTFARIKLLGPVLSTLTLDDSGRFAWMVVRRADMEWAGASDDEIEGIINLPRSIGQLEVVAMFRELPTGGYRVSLRSKRRVDVAEVAGAFGGGGHVRAAGLTVSGPLEAAVAAVGARIRAALESDP